MKILILALLVPFSAFARSYNSYDCGAALMQSFQPLSPSTGFAPETGLLRFETHAHVRGDQVFGFTLEVAHADPGFPQYTLAVARTPASATVNIVFSRNDMDGKPNTFGDYGVAIKDVSAKYYSSALEGEGDILLSSFPIQLPDSEETGMVVLTCFKK